MAGRRRRGSGRRGRRRAPDLEAGPGYYQNPEEGCDTTTILLTILLGLLIIVGVCAVCFRDKLFGSGNKKSKKKGDTGWFSTGDIEEGGQASTDADESYSCCSNWIWWLVTGGVVTGVITTALYWHRIGPWIWQMYHTRFGTKPLNGEGAFLKNENICSTIKGDKEADAGKARCVTKMDTCKVMRLNSKMSSPSATAFTKNDTKLLNCIKDVESIQQNTLGGVKSRQNKRELQNKLIQKNLTSPRLKDREARNAIEEMCKVGPGNKAFKVPNAFIGDKKRFERAMNKHIKDVESAKKNVNDSIWNDIKSFFTPNLKNIPWLGAKEQFKDEFRNDILESTDYKTGSDSKKAAMLQEFARKNRGSFASKYEPRIPGGRASYNATLWNKLHTADEKAKNKADDNFVETYRGDADTPECIDPNHLDPVALKATVFGKLHNRTRTDQKFLTTHWDDKFYEKTECLADIQGPLPKEW